MSRTIPMIRIPFAVLVAVTLASPALAAQGICEFVTDRGAPPLPAPAALLDVERVRATLLAMPEETPDEDAFAAVTVWFDQAGRAEGAELFLRPGVSADARALRDTVLAALVRRASGPRGGTAVMMLERGPDAAVRPVPIRQECLPRLINEQAVREEIDRGLGLHRPSVNTSALARFRVDERGRIGRVRVIRRTNVPEIDVLFRGAVERAVFEPGSVEGIPIARWLEYPLRIFMLR